MDYKPTEHDNWRHRQEPDDYHPERIIGMAVITLVFVIGVALGAFAMWLI